VWAGLERGPTFGRVCEQFPDLPRSMWDNEERLLIAQAVVCVHPEGFVYQATLARSTGREDVDKVLLQSIRRWRYRPYVREGKPQAFCHNIQIQYGRRNSERR
jgi:hypothetical protein